MTRFAGLVRVGLLALIWGSGFLFIKIGLRGFTPVQVTFARLALGALCLSAVLMLRGTHFPRDRVLWFHLTVAALLGECPPVPPVRPERAAHCLQPRRRDQRDDTLVTVALALAVRADRELTRRRLMGIVIGFAGAVIVVEPWRSNGDVAVAAALGCLLASASYAASYVYIGRYVVAADLPPLTLPTGQLIAATFLSALTLPFDGLAAPEWRLDAALAVLILGTVGTGAAYVLNYRIIRDEGPTAASAVTYLLPIVAVVFGWLVLSERITAPMALGGVIVLIGVGLSRRSYVGPRIEGSET